MNGTAIKRSKETKFLIRGIPHTYFGMENGYLIFISKGELVEINYLDFQDLYSLGKVSEVI